MFLLSFRGTETPTVLHSKRYEIWIFADTRKSRNSGDITALFFLCRLPWNNFLTDIGNPTISVRVIFVLYFDSHYIQPLFFSAREFWIIYRGTGFPAIAWFAPPPFPFCQYTCSAAQKDWEEKQLADGRGGGMSQIIRPQESQIIQCSLYSIKGQEYFNW
jgi:hypothetical protein